MGMSMDTYNTRPYTCPTILNDERYSCDWSKESPRCIEDPKGWATKDQCAAICKKSITINVRK